MYHAFKMKNGVESKSRLEIANGHTNGNGFEAKTDVVSPTGIGFLYNEYDGKA